MATGLALDRDAIARVCRAYGVSRLQLFGSATSELFDNERSDVDFLIEFLPSAGDPFAAYFGVKESLETLVGREVDLVMASAVRNPHFAASANRSAEDVYAA